MTKHIALTLSAFSLSLFALAGCNTAEDQNVPIAADASEVDDHGHGHGEGGHEHAESYGEAVEELAELRDTVRDAFAEEDMDTAHGPLHDVGHILEEVSELAGKELTEEQQAAVKSSVDKLFDLFGSVDKMMHGQEGSEYSEVSDDIDAAIATLSGFASESAEHDEDGEHHHEEGDDDEHEEGHDDDDADGEGEASEESADPEE